MIGDFTTNASPFVVMIAVPMMMRLMAMLTMLLMVACVQQRMDM